MHHGSSEDRESAEVRFRLLVEAVTDYAIYMLDPEGHVVSWNSGARRFKGYEEHEILGEHFSRFYTEEAREAGIPRRALQIAAEEGRFENEGWRVRKDGSRFWAHIVIDQIRDPSSGTLTGFAKITRDITDRKAAEEALRRSDAQFRLLVQGAADYAIFMIDPEGRVTNWNLGAQRIKGYRPDEIIGKHFSRFYTEEDRAQGRPRLALETALREGKFESEGWRLRKDGSRFCANVVIRPIHDSESNLIGFAKITRDVTERKEAEEALEETREKLLQSQKMEAIGQLTGGIAHDFNNLLMAVLASLDLMRKRLPDDPYLVRLLDNAVKGAERGTSLTQRMLAFARRQPIDPVAVDVADVVRNMRDLLERALGGMNPLETRMPHSLPSVRADPHQLELAVLNLAINARDAMPDGGTIVIEGREVQLARDEGPVAPGAYVCLSLIDTGEGMDEYTLQRAAEPFFTTKGTGKGTGLGLSATHGIVEQLGGRLVLKSKMNEGTTAELWIPQAQATDEEAAKAGKGETQQQKEIEIKPLKVLAVDDDALVLMNLGAMLEELGHEAIEAPSAREALEALEKEPGIALVITDQAMPKMTGLELAQAVREKRSGLPIILATGYAELSGDEVGDLIKLEKPFFERDLAEAIAAATGMRQQ